MGILDDLFSIGPQTNDLGASTQPLNGTDLGYTFDHGNPIYGYDDYVGDVPTKRKPQDIMDRDLKRFREDNPLKAGVAAASAPPMAAGAPLPAQMPAGAAGPIPGMLGPEMGGPFGAVGGAAPLATPAGQPVTAAASPAPAAGQPSSMLSKTPMGPQPITPPPGDATLPPGATPTVGQGQPPGVPSGAHGGSPAEGAIDFTHAGPGMLSKVWQGIQDNSGLLMGMGAGMLGAPSWATGMSRGFAGAAAGNQIDQRYNMQMGGQQALYSSLYGAMVNAGTDPRQARLQAIAATTNPKLAEALTAEYLTTRKAEIKSLKSKDAWGNETERLVAVDPYTNATRDVTPGAGTADAAGASSATFAPGVTAQNFDHTKVGDDYLAQYSPEMQAWVKNYLAGYGMPTGRQGATQQVKAAAMKYGQDIGMPADDSAIGQRKEWATSLANTKTGVGLQAKGFQQGLEHLANLSDMWVKARQAGGFGFEPLARGENAARGLSSKQTGINNDIAGKAQDTAGEVGKLYSGASGGGVHERDRTFQRLGDTRMSGPAAAGAIKATLDDMEGGLKPLERRRDDLFPHGNAPKGSNFRGPEEEKAIEKIRRNIAILNGGQPADAAPAAAPAAGAPKPAAAGKTQTGISWSVQN